MLVDAKPDGTDARVTVHYGLSAPLARLGATSPVFLVPRKDGSVAATFDAQSKLVETHAYTAYGETSIKTAPGATPSGNRFGYQGHIYDAATGLYQMRARYYAPRWGRFVSVDPMGAMGGPNVYAFRGNRPGGMWDPFGLCPYGNPSARDWGR